VQAKISEEHCWASPILFGTEFAQCGLRLSPGILLCILWFMSRKRKKIREQDVQGVKQLEQLRPLMSRLHDIGCERDRADNRTLHMDQYVMLVLLSFFNPIVTSLRGIQQASELNKVQRKLGCARASLGSLSEATQVFRSAELQAIIGEVVAQLDLQQVPSSGSVAAGRLTAVDGTLLAKLPQITQAAWQSRRHPTGWRMHTQFEILRGAPVAIEITDGRNKGPSNEKHVLRHSLEADRCYVIDRGYEQFSLFNAIVAAKSSYVCRIRGDHCFTVETSRELSSAAFEAGVTEDSVGKLGSPKSVRIEPPEHTVRLVRVSIEPHPKRGGRRREAASQDVVLLPICWTRRLRSLRRCTAVAGKSKSSSASSSMFWAAGTFSAKIRWALRSKLTMAFWCVC